VGLGLGVRVGARVAVGTGVRVGVAVAVGSGWMVRTSTCDLSASPLSARNSTCPASSRLKVTSAVPPVVVADTGGAYAPPA
jgi:tetrahydrodipicolinate N-succinyltransferase